MPIFEYHCDSCGINFEYLVMGSTEPENCPTCKGKQVCRLMSACSFVSKGSGGGGGETVSSSSSSSSCGGCTATSCNTCGH